MSFTARRISTSAAADADDGNPVVRRERVAQSRDAAALIERARGAAFSIVKRARKTAKRLDMRASAARRARKARADFEFVARAAALEVTYRQAQRSLTAQLERTLDHVLAEALAHVGAAVPAAQRLRIVCEQLSKAAGPVAGARLCLCPADEVAYRGAAIGAPWPIEIDTTLEPGHCRLACEDGEWVLDFDALMAALAPDSSTRATSGNTILEGGRATMVR